jgi:hypothetical protein
MAWATEDIFTDWIVRIIRLGGGIWAKRLPGAEMAPTCESDHGLMQCLLGDRLW